MTWAFQIFIVQWLFLAVKDYAFICGEKTSGAAKSEGSVKVALAQDWALCADTAATASCDSVAGGAPQLGSWFSCFHSKIDGVNQSLGLEVPAVHEAIERFHAALCLVRDSVATMLRSDLCPRQWPKALQVGISCLSGAACNPALELPSTTSAATVCRLKSRTEYWARTKSPDLGQDEVVEGVGLINNMATQYAAPFKGDGKGQSVPPGLPL